TQLDEHLEEPGPHDLYTVGMEGIVERMLKLPDGSTSILLRGHRRLRRTEYLQDTPYMRVRAEAVEEVIEPSLGFEALRRTVLALFEKCVRLSNTLTDEAYITAMNIDPAGSMADFMASSLDVPISTRQNILET